MFLQADMISENGNFLTHSANFVKYIYSINHLSVTFLIIAWENECFYWNHTATAGEAFKVSARGCNELHHQSIAMKNITLC